MWNPRIWRITERPVALLGSLTAGTALNVFLNSIIEVATEDNSPHPLSKMSSHGYVPPQDVHPYEKCLEAPLPKGSNFQSVCTCHGVCACVTCACTSLSPSSFGEGNSLKYQTCSILMDKLLSTIRLTFYFILTKCFISGSVYFHGNWNRYIVDEFIKMNWNVFDDPLTFPLVMPSVHNVNMRKDQYIVYLLPFSALSNNF